MRHAGATLMICSIALVSAIAFAQPARPAAPPVSTSPAPEQIAAWVQQLDSDQFATREDATQRLIAAGAVAVRPLSASLNGGSPEAGMRALYILKELALAGEENTEEAAREALQAVADGPGSSFARKAAATIAMLDTLRHQRAITELERLGAKVTVANTQIGGQVVLDMQSVEIGEDWKGEEKDLRWLKWLGNVDQIVFRRVKINEAVLGHLSTLKKLKVLEIKYVPVGDAALAHLKELTGILAVRLYGTSISKEGAEKLQAALADAKIDLRQGGFLGVGGQAHPKGFIVTIVHPGSAADKADLQVNDVIVKYHDKPIADFEALTAEISKNRPGDTIRLEILRDDTMVLMKSLTLGEWDERARQ
jgi:hypothetical protein